MSKHTPGPWVVTPHPETHVDVFGVGEIKDDKEFQYGLSHTFCYQNAEANARLIAAAPELLAELEMLSNIVEGCGMATMPEVECRLVFARAAIAKATGEA
ncbi:TPA: hypothetical protein ACGCGJ_000431 [Stenotrophomonas maltophilia]